LAGMTQKGHNNAMVPHPDARPPGLG